MIVDANILLHAQDSTSRFHDLASQWLSEALNGSTRVGLPWSSLVTFMRLRTHPRVYGNPLSGAEAAECVQDWLAAPAAWDVAPTHRHADVLARLLDTYQVSGNLLPDAHLAALAIEHGVAVVSADTDFARFPEVTWVNPIARRAG